METDPDFVASYRDLRLPDLIDSMSSWADRKYERKTPPLRDAMPMKRAPFYSINELHNIPGMDDELFQLIAPQFTTGYLANEININAIQEPVLRSLVPNMTKEEVQEFFKTRDSESADNMFKTNEAFFEYLTKNVTVYRNNPKALDDLKATFTKRKITLTTDESVFKITVQATVNSATRTIRAWVKLGKPSQPAPAGTLNNNQPFNPRSGEPNPALAQNPSGAPDSGMTIYFMKID